MDLVEKVFTRVSRALEFALTGRTEYRMTLSDFAEAKTINGSVQARLVLDELRPFLEKTYRIKLTWPVLLELKQPPPRSWKGSFYHAEGNVGRYIPQDFGQKKAHQIMVIPGLPRPKFRSILGHELVHAHQTEAGILVKNQALREGMARWVEYHLLKEKHPRQAKKLLKIRHFTFGRAIRIIVDYEKEHGREATLAWLRTYDQREG